MAGYGILFADPGPVIAACFNLAAAVFLPEENIMQDVKFVFGWQTPIRITSICQLIGVCFGFFPSEENITFPLMPHQTAGSILADSIAEIDQPFGMFFLGLGRIGNRFGWRATP